MHTHTHTQVPSSPTQTSYPLPAAPRPNCLETRSEASKRERSEGRRRKWRRGNELIRPGEVEIDKCGEWVGGWVNVVSYGWQQGTSFGYCISAYSWNTKWWIFKPLNEREMMASIGDLLIKVKLLIHSNNFTCFSELISSILLMLFDNYWQFYKCIDINLHYQLVLLEHLVC